MPNALQGLLADPRGEMQATPRKNKLLGLLADALTAANDYAQAPDPRMPGGKANPVLGLLADAAGLPSLATTAQRVSYGEPLTNGLRGSKAWLKPETADVAMMAPISPRNALAALGMGMADTGAAKAIFAGIGAKTADKAALAQAEKLTAAGADPRQVWTQTGWFKGGDGKWRFEIDDSAAKLRDYNFTPKEAFKEARDRAFINDEPRDAVRAMAPYASMTKNQLKDEYKRTGGLIVDAAKSGDMAGAQKMLEDRAGLDGLLSEMRSRTYGPASSFLSHGQLGAAYPDVYKLHTRIGDTGSAKAEYLRASPVQGEQIVLGNRPTWSDDKSTMLHELQHAVQQREGFARGGSAEMFGAQFDADLARLPNVKAQVEQKRNAALDQARVAVARDPVLVQKARAFAEQAGEFSASAPIESQVADYLLANDEGYRRAYKELSDLQQASKMTPHDRYQRLAGEAEARAVQSRINMTPQQRREVFPLDSYDVPINSLIYR